MRLRRATSTAPTRGSAAPKYRNATGSTSSATESKRADDGHLASNGGGTDNWDLTGDARVTDSDASVATASATTATATSAQTAVSQPTVATSPGALSVNALKKKVPSNEIHSVQFIIIPSGIMNDT